MLASSHIANQVLAKCSLQNANAKCVHPPILRACKDAKCVHKAYCILAILAECMRSCKNAKCLHSWHDFSRMQNACIHPYCILARRERPYYKLLTAKCVHLAFLQNAKCKMQRTAMGLTGFYGIPMYSMDPKPEAEAYLQSIMGLIESY